MVFRKFPGLVLTGLALAGFTGLACHRQPAPAVNAKPTAAAPAKPARPAIPVRPAVPALAAGETFSYAGGAATRQPIAAATAAGLLDVDLGDDWAPMILQDGEGADAKPNAYRETFVGLANDRLDADGDPVADPSRRTDHNYLEVFGIPPALSVLASRIEDDVTPAREACYDAVDREGLETFTGDLGFLDRDRSRRDYEQALKDADWLEKEIAARTNPAVPDGGVPPAVVPNREAALAAIREEPKLRARADRFERGKVRLRAVRAAQARLLCEGLLTPRSKFTPGMYDLPTHEALAIWERKNDVFGWGFLGGETMGTLLQPTRALLLDAFKRFLAERVADAAGIVEDGSINLARRRNPPSWKDEAGALHPVPDLIGEHVGALLTAIGVATAEDAIAFLRAHKDGLGKLRVAFQPPALPRLLHAGRGGDGDEPVGRDRPRRHLVRLPVRRARQDDRTEARSLPAPDDVRALARAEDPALLVADDHRLVAQRGARRRQRLLQVQELGHRAAGLEADRRHAGLDPARGDAGQGSAEAQGAGP